MYTVYDYIKYYKNVSISKSSWNEIDNLICAILSYLPLNSIDEKVNISNIYLKINKRCNDNIILEKKALEILTLIEKSIRYKDMFLLNCVHIKNKETQFCAMTFTIEDISIISYKGTDSSFIGWLENFRLFYEYPNNTQKLALDYLESNISFLDSKEIYVVGHSKGGNLAMYCTMETTINNFNRIEKVYNFDGPGFRKKEYDNLNYKRLCTKLVNVLPSGSVIGALMYNNDYKVVKSNAITIFDHFPTSWNVFGEFFIDDKLSSISKKLNYCTTSELEKIDYNLLKENFETFFKKLGKEHTDNLDISFRDIKNIYDSMKEIDPVIKEYLDKIFHTLLMPSSKISNKIGNEKVNS